MIVKGFVGSAIFGMEFWVCHGRKKVIGLLIPCKQWRKLYTVLICIAFIGKNNNDQVYFIYWAIVEWENNDSWECFLKDLQSYLGLEWIGCCYNIKWALGMFFYLYFLLNKNFLIL